MKVRQVLVNYNSQYSLWEESQDGQLRGSL